MTAPTTAPTAEVFEAFCSAGLWPTLGKTVAARLAEAGIRSPDDVTESALGALPGVSATRAAKLVTAFASARPRYEVVAMLVPAGLPARLAFGVSGALGPGAAGQLADDPWRLLDAGEADLAAADRLARSLGVDRSAPGRGPAVLVHLLTLAARQGDTAMTRAALLAGARGRGVADPEAGLEAAEAAGRLVVVEVAPEADTSDGTDTDTDADTGPDPGADLVALPRYAMAEEALADGLARLAATAEPFGEKDTFGVTGLDDEQKAAVLSALQHGVTLLTGGPGTGKSRTVAAVVELAVARGCQVALAAPTGRAAKRLEELATSDAVPAMTLHRLLGATPGRSSSDDNANGGLQNGLSQWDGPTFSRDEQWPLDADLVVVDEASMLDVELAAGLLDACSDGTHLLIVGDPAQLPSIGAGRVLGDLVDSGVLPTTELVTLYRQAEGGTIARLATSVRGGELPTVDDPSHEVVVVPARDSADAARRVVQLVTDSIPRALGIAPGEVQVVTPVHRGPAGTEALNAELKRHLNPSGSAGTPSKTGGVRPSFDVGDRIVAVANHLDLGFANGEVGTVVARTSDGLEVAFATGPATIPVKNWGDLRHGWAVTVHRAQGSEWPAVVVVLPPEAGSMLTRPLIYTAMTRAERHLSVVPAVGPALHRAVREVGGRPRTTQLRALLRAAVEA
jgi:exodeoxyribonuclease V alpha subunit